MINNPNQNINYSSDRIFFNLSTSLFTKNSRIPMSFFLQIIFFFLTISTSDDTIYSNLRDYDIHPRENEYVVETRPTLFGTEATVMQAHSQPDTLQIFDKKTKDSLQSSLPQRKVEKRVRIIEPKKQEKKTTFIFSKGGRDLCHTDSRISEQDFINALEELKARLVRRRRTLRRKQELDPDHLRIISVLQDSTDFLQRDCANYDQFDSGVLQELETLMEREERIRDPNEVTDFIVEIEIFRNALND